jgi:hypothetical protein
VTPPSDLCPGPGVDFNGFGQCTSVLLPMTPENSYRPAVMMFGPQQPARIDLGASTPAWQPTQTRTLAGTPRRFNGCAVLLPTGEVLAVGGTATNADDTTAVLALELYHPETDSWTTLPNTSWTQIARGYHSVALLMPDGRVWIAGGNKFCDWSYHNSQDYAGAPQPTDVQEAAPVNLHPGQGGGPVDNRELHIEIFEPWYHGRPDRPTFALGVNQTSVGGSLHLQSAEASSIARVAAVRTGSCTHGFNSDQRYVGLPFVHSGSDLIVTLPDNESLLPPGQYLIFIIAQVTDPATGATLSVPSEGQFLRIDNAKHIKEFKPEIDHQIRKAWDIKAKDAEGDPRRQPLWGDPPELLGAIAARLDNLERREARGHAFIRPGDRPDVPTSVLAIDRYVRNPMPSAQVYAEAHGQMPMGGPPMARKKGKKKKDEAMPMDEGGGVG